jgi:hypothetical protein
METYRLLEPFQGSLSLVGEDEALASGQLLNDVGGQDLTGLGVCAYSGSESDSGAEQVSFLRYRLPSVQPEWA